MTVTYAETSLPQEYIDYYTPSNVQFYNDTFTFGKNLLTGEPISWQQEVNYNPYNSEIQDYLKGYTGLDDNNNLVLRIQRNGTNSYQSSRVNTQLYDGTVTGYNPYSTANY